MHESESTAQISDEKKEHEENNYIIMRVSRKTLFKNESG